MAKALNFAVVGLGMGGHHCMAVRAAKGANLAAVCDTDPKRLESRMKEFDVKGYADYADVLKDPTIDAVCIVTESGKHTDMGIQAARAGKHLIVEKPVDITPARIRKLKDVVEKTGVKAGCIFQSRMDKCNVLIKKAIDAGRMGPVIGAHACLPWFRANSYYEGDHGPWRGTWAMDGGGALMNQGIHTVDLLQFFAGRVASVCGFYGVFSHKIEAEDQTVAILKFENGALGTLFSTTCCVPENDQMVFIYGEKGSFRKRGGMLEAYNMGSKKEQGRMMELFGGKPRSDAAASDPMAVSADGHTLIIEDLVKAVRQNREPVITIDRATHAVEIACAIYKSARTGREVKIADVAR